MRAFTKTTYDYYSFYSSKSRDDDCDDDCAVIDIIKQVVLGSVFI